MLSEETGGESLEPDETLVAWTAMPRRAAVIGVGGALVGTAESLLGDEVTDIFHGLVVKRQTDGRMVELLADRIERITTRRVLTTLTADEAARLEPYEDKP